MANPPFSNYKSLVIITTKTQNILAYTQNTKHKDVHIMEAVTHRNNNTQCSKFWEKMIKFPKSEKITLTALFAGQIFAYIFLEKNQSPERYINDCVFSLSNILVMQTFLAAIKTILPKGRCTSGKKKPNNENFLRNLAINSFTIIKRASIINRIIHTGRFVFHELGHYALYKGLFNNINSRIEYFINKGALTVTGWGARTVPNALGLIFNETYRRIVVFAGGPVMDMFGIIACTIGGHRLQAKEGYFNACNLLAGLYTYVCVEQALLQSTPGSDYYEISKPLGLNNMHCTAFLLGVPMVCKSVLMLIDHLKKK